VPRAVAQTQVRPRDRSAGISGCRRKVRRTQAAMRSKAEQGMASTFASGHTAVLTAGRVSAESKLISLCHDVIGAIRLRYPCVIQRRRHHTPAHKHKGGGVARECGCFSQLFLVGCRCEQSLSFLFLLKSVARLRARFTRRRGRAGYSIDCSETLLSSGRCYIKAVRCP